MQLTYMAMITEASVQGWMEQVEVLWRLETDSSIGAFPIKPS